MQRRALAVVTVAALVLGLLLVGVPGVASAHGSSSSTFAAVLLGRNEVPGPGDADGIALASVRFEGTQACFALAWRNIAAPTRAHIHAGPRTVAGPIVLPFFEGEVPSPIASARGCVPVERSLVNDIRKRPDQFYFNIHNADFPAGAVRGQLHRFGRLPSPPGRLDARLLGSNEVPPADPDGSGRARVTPFGTTVCWRASWRNIATPTRGHIHEAPAGVNGPIVVPFFEAPAGLPATISSVDGCTTGLDRALVKRIRRNPSGFYVNIHNADFPGGAIRGQLHRS